MNGRIQQHFRPTVTDPGFDVVTENRFFVDRVEGIEWEEREFRSTARGWRAAGRRSRCCRPRRCCRRRSTFGSTRGIAIAWRAPRPSTAGAACVVAFEPLRRDQSLYRGTVWIDRETLRAAASAGRADGACRRRSSRTTRRRTSRPCGRASGGEIWLPSRIDSQQLFLIAGRNLLVERRIAFSDYELDPGRLRRPAPGGARRRAGDVPRHRPRHALLREGGRHARRERRATTRAKALALGVTIDPSFDFPLPIVGINYLDFEFGRPDTQLALLFGGVLAAGNIQRPKAIATDRRSVDFFAIAVPGTDRVYGPGGDARTSAC